jgi:hypothetical protein
VGTSQDIAKHLAGNCHRWWRNSAVLLNSVLTIAYFDRLECRACPDLMLSNRPVRTRMRGGAAGAQPVMAAPYADVRPAWAHSCGCKSRRKLITANEVKRNCIRVTDCGMGKRGA